MSLTTDLALQSKSLVTDELKMNGFQFIKGEQIDLPESLKNSFNELAQTFSMFKAERYFNKRLNNYFFGSRNSQVIEFVCENGKISMNMAKNKNMPTDETIVLLYGNTFIKKLVNLTLSVLPDYTPEKTYEINVLLTRHEVSVNSDFYAHQDSFCDWLAQFNINRSSEGIEGGEVQLFKLEDSSDNLVTQRLLSKPLDGYFLNDALYKHSASSINITKEGAVRDIVVIRRHKQNSEEVKQPQFTLLSKAISQGGYKPRCLESRTPFEGTQGTEETLET